MKTRLKFNKNQKFKIMMFSDLQDKLPIDARSLACLDALIEAEKPDFVISAGDHCDGRLDSPEELRQYVTEMSRPMEARGIWWSQVFGNHDDESIATPLCDKEHQQMVFESFPHCLSEHGPREIAGVGNYMLPIYASDSDDTVFHIWALDSNTYLDPDTRPLAQNPDGGCWYDYIRPNQIRWYQNGSLEAEKRVGHRIPGLMFFHIALPAHRLIGLNPAETHMTGEQNEGICCPPINSGLFAAVLERGDVRGIFVGHDHVNDYTGQYLGVTLGFDGSIGYGNYGLPGDERARNRLRGARFFVLHEERPAEFETYMRYGREFGI